MVNSKPRLSQIHKIDNSRGVLPLVTGLMLIFLIFFFVWFLRGGSFKLYASMFFGIYFLIKNAWLSIILVSVFQNLLFLPFRIINHVLNPEFKKFEKELERTKEDKQYILFNKKITEGNKAIVFYVLNFILLAIAFFSAGRVFLLDLYHHPISRHYLYDFIPYPQYPLSKTIFYFPFFKITQTISFSTSHILLVWLYILILLVVLRFVWRLVFKFFFSKNKQLLQARFKYNRFLLSISGFACTAFILSFILFKHFPVAFEPLMLSADIAVKNTVFNIITATCTFLVTIHAGWQNTKHAIKRAQAANIPEPIITKVARSQMKNSLRNAVFLSISAYLITHQMPCSHDLSVLAFEAVYIIFPRTIDKYLGIAPPKH